MNENELIEFLYQVPIGILKSDINGNVLIINPAATNLLITISPNNLIEQNLNIFNIFSIYDKYLSNRINDAIDNNKKIILENYEININKNNIKKLKIKCVKLISNEFAFIIEDITKLIELEEKKQQIQNQLDEQQERLIKIGQAIRYIIHDLRNPIGNIKTISEMIELLSLEELKDLFSTTIKPILNEINSLMEDLLDYTKIDIPKLNKVNINSIINHLKLKFEYFQKEFNIPIKFFYDENFEILCDEQKIIRIFNNICGNALKALKKSEISNPQIDVLIKKNQNNILFQIKDNGKGIPVELLDKLFEPFAFKSEYVGNGIGLSIVKNIVDMHNGTINVNTGKNGTIFDIIIPQ